MCQVRLGHSVFVIRFWSFQLAVTASKLRRSVEFWDGTTTLVYFQTMIAKSTKRKLFLI